MARKHLENIKVTHEEVINQLALQIASIQVENTVIKLELQKLKDYISKLDDTDVEF